MTAGAAGGHRTRMGFRAKPAAGEVLSKPVCIRLPASALAALTRAALAAGCSVPEFVRRKILEGLA